VQLNVVVAVGNYSFISVQISDKGYHLLWKDSAEHSYLLSFISYGLVIYFLGEFHCQEFVTDFAPNGDRYTCPSQNVCLVSFLFSEWSLAKLSNATTIQMF
jgi:hypothetical protein